VTASHSVKRESQCAIRNHRRRWPSTCDHCPLTLPSIPDYWPRTNFASQLLLPTLLPIKNILLAKFLVEIVSALLQGRTTQHRSDTPPQKGVEARIAQRGSTGCPQPVRHSRKKHRGRHRSLLRCATRVETNRAHATAQRSTQVRTGRTNETCRIAWVPLRGTRSAGRPALRTRSVSGEAAAFFYKVFANR
jgi:hypothetical protein